MTTAYDYDMMPYAQKVLGWAFDTGINYYGMNLAQFYHLFLNSPISRKFASGDPFIIMGKSGRELAYELISPVREDTPFPQYITMDRSQAFWLGWALAYYQWTKNIPFSQITEDLGIETYWNMYDKYHEMDITQFVDGADDARKRAQEACRLKRMRTYAGLSQKQLADLSGVPIRTIQQYEQKAKDINKANVEYMISLSKALHCDITALLEED